MKIVAYYRVSTKRQQRSGLGLDAQRAAVEKYAADNKGKIVAEFTEAESGRNDDRPELAKAIARTRAVRGKLVIAKLDRLSRSVAFTAALMESGCDFVCCDMPAADRFTIHVLAAVAEQEHRRICERIREALTAAKKRGVPLGTNRPGHTLNRRKGTRNGLAKATAKAATVRGKARNDCYSFLLDDMQAWRAAGVSYAAIAAKLNEAGHVTTSGKEFAAMTVQRILA